VGVGEGKGKGSIEGLTERGDGREEGEQDRRIDGEGR